MFQVEDSYADTTEWNLIIVLCLGNSDVDRDWIEMVEEKDRGGGVCNWLPWFNVLGHPEIGRHRGSR